MASGPDICHKSWLKPQEMAVEMAGKENLHVVFAATQIGGQGQGERERESQQGLEVRQEVGKTTEGNS